MPTKDSIVVSVRIKREEAERLKERAEYKGKSLGELLKEGIGKVEKDVKEDSIASKINELAFVYDIDAEKLLTKLENLLGSGKLYVENGNIEWNPTKKNPEYVSVDERIDELKVSEKEKDRLKESIISNFGYLMNKEDNWA